MYDIILTPNPKLKNKNKNKIKSTIFDSDNLFFLQKTQVQFETTLRV